MLTFFRDRIEPLGLGWGWGEKNSWNQLLLRGSLLAAGCISFVDQIPTGRGHLLIKNHVPLDRDSSWWAGGGDGRPGFIHEVATNLHCAHWQVSLYFLMS